MKGGLRSGTALVLWLIVAGIILAVAVAAILMFGRVGNIVTTTQTTSSVETVSDSDEVSDLQKELDDTSFDDIDRDVGDTEKDLSSF